MINSHAIQRLSVVVGGKSVFVINMFHHIPPFYVANRTFVCTLGTCILLYFPIDPVEFIQAHLFTGDVNVVHMWLSKICVFQ